MKDSRKRTFIKTITDKVMEIGISQVILHLVGLPLGLAVGLPILIEIIQIGSYIINERIWSKIDWECSHEGMICEECGRNCSCPLGRHHEGMEHP